MKVNRYKKLVWITGVTALGSLSLQSFAQVLGGNEPAAPIIDAALQLSSARLGSAMMVEIGRLPADSFQEDYEASMMFVIEQQDYPLPMIMNALDQLEAAGNPTKIIANAIENVRQSLLRRRYRGTAALANGTAEITGQGLSFPVIETGTGSSNYGS